MSHFESSDLDFSRVVAVEDGGCVALEAEVVVEEGGAEEGQVLELVQSHGLLHKLPSLRGKLKKVLFVL